MGEGKILLDSGTILQLFGEPYTLSAKASINRWSVDMHIARVEGGILDLAQVQIFGT